MPHALEGEAEEEQHAPAEVVEDDAEEEHDEEELEEGEVAAYHATSVEAVQSTIRLRQRIRQLGTVHWEEARLGSVVQQAAEVCSVVAVDDSAEAVELLAALGAQHGEQMTVLYICMDHSLHLLHPPRSAQDGEQAEAEVHPVGYPSTACLAVVEAGQHEVPRAAMEEEPPHALSENEQGYHLLLCSRLNSIHVRGT